MSANIYDSTAKKLIPFAGNSEATAGSLDGLSDVNISSPTDGQVLTYDATNDVWVNEEGAAVIESLGDIADVDLTNLEDGQTIVWDATEEKWVPGTSGTNYTAGFGISIENDEIKTTDFVGTQAQWNALTSAEKAAYDFVHITDDASPENYSPGHAISDGTSEKTQREVLEFEGFAVTDDSVNGKTKVAEVPYTAGDGVEITAKEISVSDEISRTWTGTTAEWNAIVDKSVYDGWIINITDDHASGVGVVADVAEPGNMNPITSNAASKLFDFSDLSFITTGLTYDNMEYFRGGYLKVGSLVFVDMSVRILTTPTSAFATHPEIHGLPLGKESFVAVPWTDNYGHSGVVRLLDGDIGWSEDSGVEAGVVATITFVYIAED